MWDTIVNFLHLFATAVWIGGAVYTHLILLPALGSIDQQASAKLQGLLAKRFSITAWSCIAILLVTGYLKTPRGLLFDPSSVAGLVLMVKHLLILLVILVGLGIALYVVPRMRRAAPQPGERPSGEFQLRQKQLGRSATVNLLLGLLILAGASMLW